MIELTDDADDLQPTAPPDPSAHKHWRVSIPGRVPFAMTVVQGITHDELLCMYPRDTKLEPMA